MTWREKAELILICFSFIIKSSTKFYEVTKMNRFLSPFFVCCWFLKRKSHKSLNTVVEKPVGHIKFNSYFWQCGYEKTETRTVCWTSDPSSNNMWNGLLSLSSVVRGRVDTLLITSSRVWISSVSSGFCKIKTHITKISVHLPFKLTNQSCRNCLA